MNDLLSSTPKPIFSTGETIRLAAISHAACETLQSNRKKDQTLNPSLTQTNMLDNICCRTGATSEEILCTCKSLRALLVCTMYITSITYQGSEDIAGSFLYHQQEDLALPPELPTGA
jgi:hypothetical protein